MKHFDITKMEIPAENHQHATQSDLLGLTKQDRCDACGAQAYVRAQMPFGQLFFCAHHAKRHAAQINTLATQILDETYKIQA